MWGWFCIINPFICWSWDQRPSLPHIVVINLLIRYIDTQFQQTCPSTKHIIPANTTEREASRDRADVTLLTLLPDQGRRRPWSCTRTWETKLFTRLILTRTGKTSEAAHQPCPTRREQSGPELSLDAVSWFSMNCPLRGRYEVRAGDCRVDNKALPKKMKSPEPSLPLFQRRVYGSRTQLLGQKDSSCPAFRKKGSLHRPCQEALLLPTPSPHYTWTIKII